MFKKIIGATAALAFTTSISATTAHAADIVDVASGAGTFNTLLAAATAAGLVDALKGPGPLTVFAPTDDAFAALPEGTVETLLKPENKDQLTAVLLYHVDNRKLTSAMLPHATIPGSPHRCRQVVRHERCWRRHNP